MASDSCHADAAYSASTAQARAKVQHSHSASTAQRPAKPTAHSAQPAQLTVARCAGCRRTAPAPTRCHGYAQRVVLSEPLHAPVPAQLPAGCILVQHVQLLAQGQAELRHRLPRRHKIGGGASAGLGAGDSLRMEHRQPPLLGALRCWALLSSRLAEGGRRQRPRDRGSRMFSACSALHQHTGWSKGRSRMIAAKARHTGRASRGSCPLAQAFSPSAIVPAVRHTHAGMGRTVRHMGRTVAAPAACQLRWAPAACSKLVEWRPAAAKTDAIAA